jgi:hypothetical protein
MSRNAICDLKKEKVLRIDNCIVQSEGLVRTFGPNVRTAKDKRSDRFAPLSLAQFK